MLCKKLEMLLVECIVRGYISGSGWQVTRKMVQYAVFPCRKAYRKIHKLPEPIYTPSTKAEIGDHDENVSFEATVKTLEKAYPGKGREYAEKLRDYTIALYKKMCRICINQKYHYCGYQV